MSQRVKIWGPNCPFPDATLHVHAEGCADLKRGVYRGLRENSDQGGYVEEHTSVEAMVLDWFSNHIEELPGLTWRDYETEFKIFPCVTIPREEPTAIAPFKPETYVVVKNNALAVQEVDGRKYLMCAVPDSADPEWGEVEMDYTPEAIATVEALAASLSSITPAVESTVFTQF